MAKKSKPTRRGRPPKAPEDQTIVLTARIPRHLKDDLDRAAAAAGHSLGKEVVSRLRRAGARWPVHLGNDQARALAMIAARASTLLTVLTGKSWRDDRYTGLALLACINNVLAHPHLIPPGSAEPPSGSAYKSPTDLGVALSIGILADLFTVPRPAAEGDDAVNADLPWAGRLLGLQQGGGGEIPHPDGGRIILSTEAPTKES